MTRFLFLALSMLLAGTSVGEPLSMDKPEMYQLRPGDTVQISVWREDTLQKQVVVLPDGSVSFPLIGRVDVAGHTTPEVEASITSKLKKYLPNPVVSVVIIGIDGSRAFVEGKVVHPGSIVINGPISVLQAISLVGGLDRFADESGIKVIRIQPDGQELLPINYDDIISGRNISTNILLKPGDTLIVP